MNMPPQRIALLALVALLLAGGIAWWWQTGDNEPTRPAGPEPELASSTASADTSRPHGLPVVVQSDDATKRCRLALRDAFNARALQLKNTQDSVSQLAYALAVPATPAVNWDLMAPDAQRNAMQRRTNDGLQSMLKAGADARGDSDVLWVAAHRCIGGEACDAVRQALLQAEPGNMLVWLREMEWAKQRDDTAAVALAFERAVSAPEYDAHIGVVPEIVHKAYGSLPLPVACADDGVQQTMQRGKGIDLGRPFMVVDHAMELASIHLPVSLLGPLRQHCMPNAGMDSARRVACRSILTRLAGGDIWIERMVALDVLVQVLGDDPEAAEWRERYRESRWIAAQLADSKIQALLQPEDHLHDEVRSMQAALQIAGRWPPPADWLPEDERSRSMILTGRPPGKKKPD